MTLTLQFILTATIYSQFQRATLGVVTELRAARNPHGLFTGDFNGDGLEDLGSYNTKQILLQIQKDDSTMWRTVQAALEDDTMTKVIAAYCNSDKMSDLIVVDGKAATIKIYLAKFGVEFYLRSSLRFKDEVPEILVADINNDTRNDLLVYGKRENGITVYAGTGSGAYTKSTTLFPQKSFSKVIVALLNDDAINDIAGIDWLDNQVNISTGFGKLKFSEPVIVAYDWEPSAIAAARVDADSFADVIVSFTHNREIHLLMGEGSGKYQTAQKIHSNTSPDELFFADINADHTSDILQFSHGKGISIWLNEPGKKFEHPEEFSGGKYPYAMVVFPHRRFDSLNVAFVDSLNSVIRIMHNARISFPQGQEQMYALGYKPVSVLSFDIIGNNLIDLAVHNKESRAISLFLNLGSGMLSGQLSFPVATRGEMMQYAIRNGSESYFIVVSPEDEQVSVTEFNPGSFQHKTYSLPSQRDAELLARYVEKNSKMLNFFLLSREAERNTASMIKFSQIAQTRFVEQTIISRFDPPVVTATMGDFDKDSDFDIAFLGANTGKRIFELRTITRSETSKTVQPRLDFTMSMREPSSAIMWNADLTNDGYPDLIINIHEPKNELMISVSGNKLQFMEPKFHARIPVKVSSRAQLKIVDVNADKKMDIVLNNSLTKEIQVFWGAGNGTFPNVSRLVSSEGIGGFTFADLIGDNSQQLVVTDSLNGWLKIISLK